MKIFYVPLEPLKERYTVQLSAAKTGWLERRWIENNIPYHRVDGETLTSEIQHGSVLDAHGRGYWACSQIMELLHLLHDGLISSDDVIYFDDFWHPGISALPYSFAITGKWPRMYAMLHAQSIDRFDFTYPMRDWMRHFEKGIGKVLSGIFVTSTCLRDLVVYAGIAPDEKVFIAGLPYNSEEVRTHLPRVLPKRKKQVVFSSRWDSEKDPLTFLNIVRQVGAVRPDIKFVITTSAAHLRSNDPFLLKELQSYMAVWKNLEVREGQTKEQYYATLLESAIQLNTADQDFVSWTLLEATTCGCRPLYPYFLSFPEALAYDHTLMYSKGDSREAAHMIIHNIDQPESRDYSWVYRKYDKSWERMFNIMQGLDYENLYSDQDNI